MEVINVPARLEKLQPFFAEFAFKSKVTNMALKQLSYSEHDKHLMVHSRPSFCPFTSLPGESCHTIQTRKLFLVMGGREEVIFSLKCRFIVRVPWQGASAMQLKAGGHWDVEVRWRQLWQAVGWIHGPIRGLSEGQSQLGERWGGLMDSGWSLWWRASILAWPPWRAP